MEHTSCDLCGRNETRPFLDMKSPETKERFALVKCQQCGLVYLNPRPGKEEILRYYPAEEYYSYKDPDIQNRGYRQRIKNFLWESQMGYKKNAKLFRTILSSLLNKFTIVSIPYKKNGRILDVGCGSGALVEWLEQHQWDAYGVDISPEACRTAQRHGLKVHLGELPQMAFPSKFFDVVLMNQVLEHLFSPSEYLREVYRILKDDGQLIISVPNIDCYESKLLKECWLDLDLPRHLYHFTPHTLKLMLDRGGFLLDKVSFKSFGLPLSYTKSSINSLMQHRGPESNRLTNLVLSAKFLYKESVLRSIKYFLSKDKADFSIFFSFYARKNLTKT